MLSSRLSALHRRASWRSNSSRSTPGSCGCRPPLSFAAYAVCAFRCRPVTGDFIGRTHPEVKFRAATARTTCRVARCAAPHAQRSSGGACNRVASAKPQGLFSCFALLVVPMRISVVGGVPVLIQEAGRAHIAPVRRLLDRHMLPASDALHVHRGRSGLRAGCYIARATTTATRSQARSVSSGGASGAAACRALLRARVRGGLQAGHGASRLPLQRPRCGLGGVAACKGNPRCGRLGASPSSEG